MARTFCKIIQQILFCLFIQVSSWTLARDSLLLGSHYLPPRTRKGLYDRPILSPLHSPARRIWSSSKDDGKNWELYLKFIAEFSAYKRWDSVELIFKDFDLDSCRESGLFLLKTAALFTSCFYLDHNVSSSENFSNHHSSPFSKPLVLCQFASKGKNIGNFTKYFQFTPKLELLVVVASPDDNQGLIETLSDGKGRHYKWTLASKLNSSHVSMENVYGIATWPQPLRNSFGCWSTIRGLEIDRKKAQGPVDFEGRLIRMATIEGPPVVYWPAIGERAVNGTSKGSGYLPDLIESIADDLNFKYTVTTPNDGSYGTEINGNWTGLVGLLQREEMDVALMSISLTAKRKMVIDFSPPVEYSANRLLIRKDWQNNELKWTAYTDPFHWQVWLAIPLTIALGVGAFMAFTHYKLLSTTPAGSAWLLSLCFLQQGQEEHVSIRTFPCRLTMGCFWILAVILYASYTARLTSYLAANTETLPLKSFDEAVANHHWKIIVVKGSSAPDRIRDAKSSNMMALWRRINHDPSSSYVSGTPEGIEKVYNERVVFFTADLLPAFRIKENCSFAWLPGEYFPGFGYMGYQKDLPFRASISDKLARLRETGLMRRMFKKWWGTKSSCSEQSDTQGQFMGMSLYETGTAFLILISGMILSVIFMLVENVIVLHRPFQNFRWRWQDGRFYPADLFSGSSRSAGSSTGDFPHQEMLQ